MIRHKVYNYSEIPPTYTGVIEIVSTGLLMWLKNGKRHRIDGPALEYPDGTKIWFKEDQVHRDNGPASIHPDGKEHYYLQGICITKEEFIKKTCTRKQ